MERGKCLCDSVETDVRPYRDTTSRCHNPRGSDVSTSPLSFLTVCRRKRSARLVAFFIPATGQGLLLALVLLFLNLIANFQEFLQSRAFLRGGFQEGKRFFVFCHILPR